TPCCYVHVAASAMVVLTSSAVAVIIPASLINFIMSHSPCVSNLASAFAFSISCLISIKVTSNK
ncbi:MAG: hypothetical protein E6396_09185, partial [Streptococcus thermophilus]|nr:hypothetical protein [Streptococcus thermophilus]